MQQIKTVGSVCSGIEAASLAWQDLGFEFKWFSEILKFPSGVLKQKYPNIPNLGDMNNIPNLLKNNEIFAPDLICGGTPCQAFSLAGWKNGLDDERGNLTLKFIDIIEENDKIRLANGQNRTIVFWENVEGVLTDKTNAFGCFISSLAGLDTVIENKKWASAGLLQGKTRNVAWRVLDAKYFGLPQQRRRLYVVAGGKDISPENILFELHDPKNHNIQNITFPKRELVFYKDNVKFEIFREFTDCLYSAYGTKWNGNAAAYNGSLFIAQNDKLRRLSPLECERLMGFPDNYTLIDGARKTNRYQAIGNSWAIPVVKWIGYRIKQPENLYLEEYDNFLQGIEKDLLGSKYYDFSKGIIYLSNSIAINCTEIPENVTFGHMYNIVSSEVPDDIFISPTGCYGIIRRKTERNIKINTRLEQVLLNISSQETLAEIEKKSLVQKRGKYSANYQLNL
ncbi:DNA cytosine methyltransferase [Moraxella sp. FZLJ2107]|uniref:DNA cytosine methyltransferase n=1 Tax=unclassified Moraxella TaxID=2685852 RepID=UPI0020C88ACC|nr:MULTISPECIES: DNA cytosine methyltransferase [unclassified Moraxella]UTO04107.1 DNA cytosine methyltransferase [Moraxella sp. FZLJ2107]UTO22940.1 DNA cytosine methyltransferase [Moraxella sp. FZLJ2109]